MFRAKAAEKSLSAASGKTARNTSDSFIMRLILSSFSVVALNLS